MHYNCIWHTKPIYLSNFQIDTISNIEVISQTGSDMPELWLFVSVVTLIKCSTEPRIQLSFLKFSLIKSTIYEPPYKNLYLCIVCRSKVFYFNQ